MRNSASGSSISTAARSASRRSSIARGRIAPPRRERRRASWSRGSPAPRATGSHARATLIASRARRCASEKMPSSILSWASPASTVARSGLGSRGTSSTARRAAMHRAGRIAGRPPDLGQSFVEQAEPDAVAPGVEPADRRFEEGRRPRRLPDRERRLRGTYLEIDAIRRGRRPSHARARKPANRSGSDESGLERRQLVGRGVATGGERGGLDRRDPGARAGRRPTASARRPPPADRRDRRRAPRGGSSGRSAAGRAPRPCRSTGGGRRSPRRPRRRSRWRAPPPGRPTGRRRARRPRSAVR